MQYVLGVDAGGTKTSAVVADEDGTIFGAAVAGAGNFQGIGRIAATRNIANAISAAINAAQIEQSTIATAGYGIAGADRPKDFETVHEMLEEINVADQYLLTNDTTIALRAGTSDGVGVALIAGTGSNTIGFNKEKQECKVGGLGKFTGDYGSATDLVEKAIIASMKGFDGRGPKTLLYDLFCRELSVKELWDIIEFFYVDSYQYIEINQYAPIVFTAADEGDHVALKLLKDTGKQVGHEAAVCIHKLFKKNDKITVVLGGSVFQKASNPVMVNSLTNYLISRFPNLKIVKLQHEPVLGAVLFGLDILSKGKCSAAAQKNAALSIAQKWMKEEFVRVAED